MIDFMFFVQLVADFYCVFVKDFVQLVFVVGNVYLMTLKSNDQPLLPTFLPVCVD